MRRVRFLSLIGGVLVFTSVAFGQTVYNMKLTGTGDNAIADGVYVSPYTGTISGPGYSYSGAMICDDFTTDSYVGQTWQATATLASSGSGKFAGESYTVAGLNGNTPFTSQQMYNAVAWLANQLMTGSNTTNTTAQANYSFAIWDIMDGQKTDPDGGALALITTAFQNVLAGYAGNNVEVFTSYPTTGISQEFLVVNGPPISTPEPTAAALLGFDLLSVFGLVFLLRRRFARMA